MSVVKKVEGQPQAEEPVVLDFGSVKSKDVRKLKEGCGPLREQIDEAVAQIQSRLAPLGADAHVVPVVVVYKRKNKKNASFSLVPNMFR